MNLIKISKQIFSYANYVKKLSTLLQKQFLDMTVPFELNGVTNVEFHASKYQLLDQLDKSKLNDCITDALDYIEQNIDQITDDINQKNWIVKNYMDGHFIPDQDNEKFSQYLAYFNKFKKKKQFLKRDIKQFKNFGQLYNYIQKFKIQQNVSSFADTLPLIASSGSIKIYKVTQFKQARILFKDTGWCVKGKGYFEDYGAPYYDVFYSGEQYALIHFDSQQCKYVNDDVFEGDQPPADFYKAVLELFKKQNNGQIICTGDFENLAPYFIDYLDDFEGIDVNYIANKIIDEYNFDGMDRIIYNLGNKCNSVLTTKTFENLQYAIDYEIGQRRGYMQDNIKQLLLDMIRNDIQFNYPNSFAYYICQKDNLDWWEKYNKLQKDFQFDEYYDEMICNTSSILDYQIHENGFKIPLYLIKNRNGVDCSYFIQNDLIDEIVDEESAKKFIDYFLVQDKQELKEFANYMNDIISDDDKLDLLYNEIKKRIDKINFDEYPDLPGLFDKKE